MSLNVNFWDHLRLYFSSGEKLDILFLFLPSVLLALSIFAMKLWGFYLFLSVMLWMLVRNLYLYFSYDYIYLIQLMFGTFFNFGFILYFFLPRVKEVYFNPRLRWWETKPRYKIDKECFLIDENEKFISGVCKDMSEGGIFFEATEEVTNDENVKIKMNYKEKEYLISAKKVYQRGNGHGCQFQSMTNDELKNVKFLVKSFKNEGAPETRPAPPLWKDFWDWLRQAMSTGKGLLPEREG
jgi:hypothetical protein